MSLFKGLFKLTSLTYQSVFLLDTSPWGLPRKVCGGITVGIEMTHGAPLPLRLQGHALTQVVGVIESKYTFISLYILGSNIGITQGLPLSLGLQRTEQSRLLGLGTKNGEPAR